MADIVHRSGGRVFADEIQSTLIYRGTGEDGQESAHAPYAAVSAAAASHAIVGMSATKGWNVGGTKAAHVIIADGDADLLRPLAARLAHGASTPGLWGTAAAYDHGDRWREDALVYLDRNRALMSDLVGTWLPGVTFRVPDAGYLAWLDFRGTPWAEMPAQRARLRAFVDANEGIDFGEAGAGHLRINFATSADILELIVRSLGDALSSDGRRSPPTLL